VRVRISNLSAVRAILDTVPQNAPNPGHNWAECLCVEIDARDIPCIVCECRYKLTDAQFDAVRSAATAPRSSGTVRR